MGSKGKFSGHSPHKLIKAVTRLIRRHQLEGVIEHSGEGAHHSWSRALERCHCIVTVKKLRDDRQDLYQAYAHCYGGFGARACGHRFIEGDLARVLAQIQGALIELLPLYKVAGAMPSPEMLADFYSRVSLDQQLEEFIANARAELESPRGPP
ncbi:MAG: hypothetical protein P1V97_07385 [Planctomycetota bacterium]|nr:hypothetical protein [Planctomycetota bacterium]